MSAHPWIEMTCRQCGDTYKVPRWRADSQFCSRECYAASLRKGPRDAS